MGMVILGIKFAPSISEPIGRPRQTEVMSTVLAKGLLEEDRHLNCYRVTLSRGPRPSCWSNLINAHLSPLEKSAPRSFTLSTFALSRAFGVSLLRVKFL